MLTADGMKLGREFLYLSSADAAACGLGLADVAVAAAVCERAVARRIGQVLAL